MVWTFNEMTTAVETYPVANVTLEIVDVTFPGNALNIIEEGKFKVKVTNNGPLVLTGVTLKIKGLNGATVKDNGVLAQFVSEFVTQPLPTLAGHAGSQTPQFTSLLSFKAPGAPHASRNLFQATLEAWDCNTDHIMNGHSDPLDTVKASYAAEVANA